MGESVLDWRDVDRARLKRLLSFFEATDDFLLIVLGGG